MATQSGGAWGTTAWGVPEYIRYEKGSSTAINIAATSGGEKVITLGVSPQINIVTKGDGYKTVTLGTSPATNVIPTIGGAKTISIGTSSLISILATFNGAKNITLGSTPPGIEVISTVGGFKTVAIGASPAVIVTIDTKGSIALYDTAYLLARADIVVNMEADIMGIENQNFQVFSGDYKKLVFEANDFDPTDVENLVWFGCDELRKEKSDMILSENEIELDLTAKETRDLPIGSYEHELKIEYLDDKPTTVARGTYYIEQPKSETL